MGLEQAVEAISELIADGESHFVERHGESALSAVQAMRSLLAERFGGDELSYGALWRDFEADPEGASDEMLGTLEALEEGDPSVAQELAVLLGEYETAIGPPPSEGSSLEEAEVTEDEALYGAPIEEVPVPDQDPDIGDGEYLYGNVVPGTVVLEEEEPLDEVAPDQVTELNQLASEGVVPAPALDDLQQVVDAYPDLEPSERQRLEHELDEVLDELSEESAADVERLVSHLSEIGRIEPDLLSAILERIEADAPDVGLPAALAARQMRAWLDGAQSARR
jgi:hypothetical protein